jgi:hypothetical protein
MLDDAALGEGWTVWNAEDDRVIVAYRPDVFDGGEFPAPCLPTIYVTRGRRNRRPEGNRNLPPDAPWMVTLYLEPDVNADPESYETPAAAAEAAADLSERFADGDVDYRGLYQVPRESYFEKLDELTGRDS